MSLHPKTLAAIAVGPPAVDVDHDTGKVKKREHPTDFARRIAQIAMEEEREQWILAAEELKAAIRRGKP